MSANKERRRGARDAGEEVEFGKIVEFERREAPGRVCAEFSKPFARARRLKKVARQYERGETVVFESFRDADRRHESGELFLRAAKLRCAT